MDTTNIEKIMESFYLIDNSNFYFDTKLSCMLKLRVPFYIFKCEVLENYVKVGLPGELSW